MVKTKNFRGIESSLQEAFETRKRTTAVISITVVTWTLFILLVNPVYSYQMLSSSLTFLPEVLTVMLNDQTLHGYNGMFLTASLAFLIGTVTVVTSVSLLKNYNSSGSVTSTLGGVIGFTGAGCASCGAGVLALAGVIGGASVLPYNGLEVQLISILILLTSLEYTGRKTGICKI